MPPEPVPLVLFVSCVRDKPVTRLPLPGSRARASPVLIGAHRDGRRTVYDEAAVIGLTQAEVDEHGRIYERTIREGNLRRRTAEEHAAYQAAQKAVPAESDAPRGAESNGPASPAGGGVE